MFDTSLESESRVGRGLIAYAPPPALEPAPGALRGPAYAPRDVSSVIAREDGGGRGDEDEGVGEDADGPL